MATFNELITQINDHIDNQRDRGTAFEKMVASYLKNEPLYKRKYKDVWMLNEVPDELGISKVDTGVDIVARDFAGKLTAVQAKFYKGKVGKNEINSFVAETSKNYYDSGIIVSTTDEWNRNAQAALKDTTKPFTIIGLTQLKHADFEWQKFAFNENNDLSNKAPKKLRKYQQTAVDDAFKYFSSNEEYHDRGKLIMAPGTGKTFTSLKITEALMKHQNKQHFNVLYLVPSIQLLSQTLFNWNSDVSDDIHMTSFSVVSDRKATKQSRAQDDDLGAKDIGFPATTDVDELMRNYNTIKDLNIDHDMTVVFSTYQSIEVIHQAQDKGYPEFDLIIADEAHRTTGASKLNESSVFTEVHSNSHVKGHLRLYQTATPKIYDQNAKKKATENSIVVSSMDDPAKYGYEIFRLGFGDAVAQGYLTDYKVSVLAVSESYINKDMQKTMAADNQLHPNDIGKIIGVWNAMVKRDGITGEITGAPMKRAIAFTDTISHSKVISQEFESVVNEYLDVKSSGSFTVDVHHVDGGLNALQKSDEIDWLGDEEISENHARLLSNVRFLTEGIDVPNLDAIIFFSPKKSQVDIVQAVGRIMRKAKDKEYGYIILPIVVTDGVDPSAALDNDKKYREVWQVLNALRSTDDRFDAEINKIDLNKQKPKNLNIIGVDSSPSEEITEETGKLAELKGNNQQMELPLDWQEMRNAFYGKVVQKVGDRRYLEDWSKDVADIAHRHIRRINDLIDSNEGAKLAFDKFLKSLRYNINDSIDQEQAVEMLAQQLITEPIFDALFGEYSFVNNNAVSKAMNNVIGAFNIFGFDKEQLELKPFYDSIKLRASGIDNAKGKQKLILTLYDKFFRTGFKKTTNQLGIVFTPVEVVDFIVNSVDYALQKYFDKKLVDKNVHLLDPFTGTGTFMTRTLHHFKKQLDVGAITYDDILYKYMHEIHANEIVLLSYYIAAINIESTFEEISNDSDANNDYVPFEGIVLTDTFASTEHKDVLDDAMFGENNERLKKEQGENITAIISNPPYSVGQNSENDDNKNVYYPLLNNAIRKTYAKESKVLNKNSLYDSYIKALRWSSDRLGSKGVIGFVTNGEYIDSRSAEGIRYSLFNEFNYIYIFNLRGNQRTMGEESRKEGGKIFGSGSRTPIAISILVKDESDNHEIFYHDIGDYLSKKEKLRIISKYRSISNIAWDDIHPDKNNDWINQRDPNFDKYKSIDNDIFKDKSSGITTQRDSWVFNFSKNELIKNVNRLINNFNYEVDTLSNVENPLSKISLDPKKIKWSREFKTYFTKFKHLSFNSNNIVTAMYRPFTKKFLYYGDKVVDYRRHFYSDFHENDFILTTLGVGAKRDFSSLAIDVIPDSGMMDGRTQVFLKNNRNDNELLHDDSNIRKQALDYFGMSSDELFYYVYAIMNSKDYKTKYNVDLKKSLARIPLLKSKSEYVSIGRELFDLHINYENISPYQDVDIINKSSSDNYVVKKMKFGKYRDQETNKLVKDKSTIIFNDDITINNIPKRAYDYIVNGRSAIEWIMDQYQVKTDKKTGITDDPNEYSDNPKYIFNLLLSIINVSMQTLNLIDQLPKFEVEEEKNEF